MHYLRQFPVLLRQVPVYYRMLKHCHIVLYFGGVLHTGLEVWEFLYFCLAVIPLSGGSHINLMRAESPGPSVGKLVPKIKYTAQILYVIYLGMTVVEIILLLISRMPVFDAITLSFGTAGTGGFGIKGDSIASYTALQQWIITIFMILFGVNFNAYYLILFRKFKKALQMEEVKAYFGIIFVSTAIITGSLVMGNMSWPDDKVDKAVAICRFTVNEKGEIVDIRVIKGTHPAFDKESIRILSNFPRLIPAMKNRKSVPYDYFLTMRFWKEDLEHYLLYRECAQEDLEKITWEPYRYSSYPGGTVALTQFINSHLKITPEMKATGKQGRVIYSFNVDIDGSMKDFQLVRGLDPLMDAEALRVLQLVNERWSTGYYFNSKKWYREFYVNQFTIPIIFSW